VWENNILVDGPAFQASAWGGKDLFETSWKQYQAWQADGTLARYLEHYPQLAGYREDTRASTPCSTAVSCATSSTTRGE